jgi:hypothetical protein
MSDAKPSRFDRVVRCTQGHLFVTTWIPLVSLKAVRLGPWRLQHCPVGHHWSIVTRIDDTTVAPEELAEARRHHDLHIP